VLCIALDLKMLVGRWVCDGEDCKRHVEYDGSSDGLFNLRRRDKQRRWLVFTRALLDKLYSYIITARTTYTAATRHLTSDIFSFALRRQDVVKLGTAMLRTLVIPAEAACCPVCGPNPEFVVIDGQALVCTDPDDANPARYEEEVPVLDIAASVLCVVQSAQLRAAISKVLHSAAALTVLQTLLLDSWHKTIAVNDRACVETAAARLFFRFFPFGTKDGRTGVEASGTPTGQAPPAGKSASSAASTVGGATEADPEAPAASTSLEAKLRKDDDGNITLGGKGTPAKLPSDSWRDRVGHCSPDFENYPKRDDGAWLHVRTFLQALLGETVTGMFQGHDEAAARLLANSLRLQSAGMWRDLTEAVDGIGFLTNFVGWFAKEIDEDAHFRYALGATLLRAVEMEEDVDKLFAAAANKKEALDRGWVNADYCRKWGGRPTPADYAAWRATKPAGDLDNPLLSFESFPGLERVRPGIKDSEALKRRVGYKGKDKHAADVEGDGDACNKAFSVKCGSTQGVFNVVCPHVITLGFRCLFRAESVGEALSIVLERFPQLPKVIFYDVACKLDKNALRSVRPILRDHNVRCILDRPHSITHTCSPIYMPDESLGATAGVATQAAEVSHSIAVANRTSLAYMKPATYMTHKMVQVAMMNIRKLQRLSSANPKAENDHIPLAPFFHSQLSRRCERGSSCLCQASIADDGRRETEQTLAVKLGQPTHSAEADILPELGALPTPSADAVGVDAAAVVTNDADGAAGGSTLLPDDAAVAAVAMRCSSDKPLWSSISTLPLCGEHVAAVNALVADRPPSAHVRRGNKAKITLTVADFRLLVGERWLNDELMNSCVALLNHRAKLLCSTSVGNPGERASCPRTYMFNTFFFSRLLERAGCYDYNGVRTWGWKNGLDIGSIDRVIIPVNVGNLHWVLVVIDVQARQFQYYDSMHGVGAAHVLATARRWLSDEVAARLGKDVARAWEIEVWEGEMDLGLPRQSDGGSCGVFVLAAADCFSLGAPLCFGQEDIPVLRQRLSAVLYVDSLVIADACSLLPTVHESSTAVKE